MAPKIGELLVSEGLITRKQLEEALKCQVIFGGRLGTNLVEMGIISEENLLRCLSKQLEIPHVTPEKLMAVTPDTIKLIPKEIAEEYKIIPLNLEKKRLTVAMWDPSDLAAIDAISFITGYIIIPVVCSELRLLLALEQHYGIKRELRYIQLSGGTGVRTRESALTETEEADEPGTIAPMERSPFEHLLGELGQTAPPSAPEPQPQWGELPEIPPAEARQPQPTRPSPAGPQRTPPPPVEEPDVLELEEAQPLEEPPPAPAPPPRPAARPEPPAAKPAEEPPPSSLDAVLSVLAEARDRDAIADALAAYLGQNFERVALFMVKGKVAAGWQGVAGKKAIPRFETFQLPLDEPSALKIVADTKNFYLGPMLDTPGNRNILAALGGGASDTVLLIPLMMMGRVVTIFYVAGGNDPGKNLFELQKLVGKAALAFEILILKNKILLG